MRRYAKGGEAQAQYQLAQQLSIMYGYTHKSGLESLGWYEKAVGAGHAQAQWKMFQIKSQGLINNIKGRLESKNIGYIWTPSLCQPENQGVE